MDFAPTNILVDQLHDMAEPIPSVRISFDTSSNGSKDLRCPRFSSERTLKGSASIEVLIVSNQALRVGSITAVAR